MYRYKTGISFALICKNTSPRDGSHWWWQYILSDMIFSRSTENTRDGYREKRSGYTYLTCPYESNKFNTPVSVQTCSMRGTEEYAYCNYVKLCYVIDSALKASQGSSERYKNVTTEKEKGRKKEIKHSRTHFICCLPGKRQVFFLLFLFQIVFQPRSIEISFCVGEIQKK